MRELAKIIILLQCRVKTKQIERININIYSYRQFHDFHDGWPSWVIAPWRSELYYRLFMDSDCFILQGEVPYYSPCLPDPILELNFPYDFLTHILPVPYLTYRPTALLSKIMGLQILISCRIMNFFRRFGGTCCLHLRGNWIWFRPIALGGSNPCIVPT